MWAQSTGFNSSCQELLGRIRLEKEEASVSTDASLVMESELGGYFLMRADGFAAELLFQPAKQAVDNGLTVFFVDCAGERNAHRASLNTVLRVATVCNAVFSHDSLKPLVAGAFSVGMHVE